MQACVRYCLIAIMGLLPDTLNCGSRMRLECRESFPPPPRVGDPDMHHGTCLAHVPWCMPWSLSGGFLWSWWRGKRSRYSRRMRNPQLYVYGKRPIVWENGEESNVPSNLNYYENVVSKMGPWQVLTVASIWLWPIIVPAVYVAMLISYVLVFHISKLEIFVASVEINERNITQFRSFCIKCQYCSEYIITRHKANKTNRWPPRVSIFFVRVT